MFASFWSPWLFLWRKQCFHLNLFLMWYTYKPVPWPLFLLCVALLSPAFHFLQVCDWWSLAVFTVLLKPRSACPVLDPIHLHPVFREWFPGPLWSYRWQGTLFDAIAQSQSTFSMWVGYTHLELAEEHFRVKRLPFFLSCPSVHQSS